MFEQLSFAGFGAAPRPTDGVFFAIFPDMRVAAHIAEVVLHLRGAHGLTGRPLETERFHVSLLSLGEHAGLPQDIVAAAGEAASAVAMPPFEVAFNRAVSFGRGANDLPFVLRGGDGVAALTAFHQALGIAMKKAGLGRWVSPHYTPHLTLLYDDRSVAEQAVETIGWTAREFVLVHSLLGRRRYFPLGRWPLRG
ncbi:2'-5' RNA ligase [Rhizobiales bacterium GAS191]|nr:2'-5' RNA ligase [Rhizobiales bacterium GAS113]SED88253.1 2'-5' RNA ligase [Rhizobiales bacterium GAS188]SEE61501.1 2'-5' RNA ligase [Rhizobiales bacterium GAS191]